MKFADFITTKAIRAELQAQTKEAVRQAWGVSYLAADGGRLLHGDDCLIQLAYFGR